MSSAPAPVTRRPGRRPAAPRPDATPSAGDTGGARRPPRPPVRWDRPVLVANLVAQIVIVGTGGAVRLSKSGLGCSTWPECEPGQFTPVMHEASSWNPLIEFGNRTLTGVLAVLAVGAAWVVWRRRDRSTGFRLLGLVPLAGVLVQALVGGLSVLVDLHPAVVGSHFLISMVLVAASTVLLLRYREGDGPPVPVVGHRVRALARALGAQLVVVLVLGVVVTGSGPHSGDAEVAYRFALDPALVSKVHAASVWLYLAGVVALTVSVRHRAVPGTVRRAAVVVLAGTVVQGAIGYVQYFTGLPEVLVGVHMLGASLLVVAQVWLTVSLRERHRAGTSTPLAA